MGPILSHSKERERGPTVPRPLPGRIQSPESPCVWTGCILDPASLLGVWLAVLYGVLLFFISVGYGPSLLSEFLHQRRYRPMKRPLSCISSIPFQHFPLKNNHYSELAILLFLCICQFRCKPTTHVAIHVNQMRRCTEWKRHTLLVHCGWIRPSWSCSKQYSPMPVLSCLLVRLRKFL